MIIRPASLDDANAIATIHVRAWQTAYRAIVPSAYLDYLSIGEREKTWRQNLEERHSETWVAEDGGQIVGWVSAGRSRDADAIPAMGEVWAIYVEPSHWRRGVGRRLWNEAEGYLQSMGFVEVTLWVLKENANAVAFYESIGLVIEAAAEKAIRRGGAELLEIRLRKIFK